MKHVALSNGTPQFIANQLPLKNKYTTFLFYPDDHFPHNLYFDAKLQLLKDYKPDYLILGGDNLNMDCFNHWAKEKPKTAKVAPNPFDYYEKANNEYFTPIREACGNKTTIIYILGNHEYWANRAVENHPEGEGYWEVENNIRPGLVDYFVQNKKGVALGNLWFYHGDNIAFRSKHHAERMVQLLHRNVMFGHYHDYEIFSLSVAVDEKPLLGFSVPCSTCVNPSSYGKDMPTNRSNGFGIGVIRPDGDFDAQVIQIKNGEFWIHDKRYVSNQTEPQVLPYTL